MKIRSDWGRTFMAKFNTGGAVESSEPDEELSPDMKISSRPIESSKKWVKTAPRSSSQQVRQEIVDNQKQDGWDMETTDGYPLGAEIDIIKIIHSMRRRKRSARKRVKSSEPWVQQIWALTSINVARGHRYVKGVGSKKMKRTRGGTKSWRMNNRVAKGKKHVGVEGDASNQSIPANVEEVKGRATDTDATKHLGVPKSDTSYASKEQCGNHANEYAFKPSSVPTAYIASQVKDSNGGPSEISLEQAAILMSNTFLGFTKSRGAVADDLMETTDVISMYQDREQCTKFDPAIIPGLDLNDGAENFDTSTGQSALASLCSLCAVSVQDPCVEFAVRVLKDETPIPAEASEVNGLFRKMTYRQKSRIAGPSQLFQGRKG
ncbi:unnamed protein product [Urochloa decumbens]|uniref:Uncharacterized protein n=1 Tax=Urochloa decumbens TaxID=240449 RepID=A0ABC9FIY6_9POAL